MEDLDLLRAKTEEIKIGGRTILVEEMTAGKAFKVVERYQKALTILAKQKGDVLAKTRLMKRYQNMLLDICIYIIRPPFSFKSISSWTITRKWLYNNMTTNQMQKFISKVMEPILPSDSKKKIKEVEEMFGL